MYMLDTNILIYFFKGQGEVHKRMLATSPQLISISSVTIFELETGLLKSAAPALRRAQLDALMAAVKILNVDHTVALAAAKIRAGLEAKGQPIGPLDTLIAATALVANASLVTRNVREFERVSGLKLENWFD